MSTENLTRPTESTARTVVIPRPADPIALLIRAYRLAGLSIEAARRCAVADFETLFPQVLHGGL
jgi:hypothetical protein